MAGIVADVYWEWEGENTALAQWLDARAIDPQATAEELRAHAAYGRGALAQWLDRDVSDCQYDADELADYEAIRAQVVAPPKTPEAKKQLDAAATLGVRQPVRVTRFRLRAESFPRGCFGDARYPGSAGETTPPPRLDLKVGRGMAECVIAGWIVGAVLERGAHVASGSKRARTMPAWGSVAQDDRLAVYNHDFLTVKMGWMQLYMPFDVERHARMRARLWVLFATARVRALLSRARHRLAVVDV